MEQAFTLFKCETCVPSIPTVDVETAGLRTLKLLLEVRDSDVLQVGRTYHITPSGLKDSSRELMDGKTVIGSDPKLCDILIGPSEKEIGRAHCCIQFDTQKKYFKIQDLGDGDGTFMKIEDNLILQNGDILSIGDSHVGVVIRPSSTEPAISLQFYEGPKANTEITFCASDDIIRIGRMRDCSVIIEDNNLSRYQCFICYHESSGWVLTDGDGNIRSANGTWYKIGRLYLDHDVPVTQGMIIRMGNTIFRVIEKQASIVDCEKRTIASTPGFK